ncbi:hypothetical protein BO82DRAFT_429258 [Aspergillus uvarum CBS 121591]|uniref:Uncharacterized protein n=1 Tax=Aspergillus uvarum CBS 121591 TaxID=1448315 RepID=A0A319CJ26_9EURO|nr:hypothetical protein BO82DRAFT_429258 [Aspergillus uvarum CBS 121591]PYH85204.1 hypothetical protein BO82DRAFT_429258 [Aspergillus uvarum CBS 121591]
MDYSGLVVSGFQDQKIRYTLFGAPVLELYNMEVDYPDFSGYIIPDKQIERACQALEDNGLERCTHGVDCPTMTGHEQPPTDIAHFHYPGEVKRIVVSGGRESRTAGDSTDSASESSASSDDAYQPMLTVRIYRKSVYMWQARDPPLRRPRAVHVDYVLSGEGENRLQDTGRNDVILPSFACWTETLFLNLCRDLIGGSVLQELWQRELEKVAVSMQDNNYLDIEPPFGDLLCSIKENLRLQRDPLSVEARCKLRRVYDELRRTGEMPKTQGALYSDLGLEPPQLEDGSEDGDGDRTPTARPSYGSDEGSGETLETESQSSDGSEIETPTGSSDSGGGSNEGSSEASSSEAVSSNAGSSKAGSSNAGSNKAGSTEGGSSQSTSAEND